MNKSANPDYSNSAVNLHNNPLVGHLLSQLRTLEGLMKAKVEEFNASEIGLSIKGFGEQMSEKQAEIREAIDEHGSFQAIDQGLYAVKQRRESITYWPEVVRKRLPKFADALIEEQVKSKAMEGLVKGGLVTREQADDCGTLSETFAYIIKV